MKNKIKDILMKILAILTLICILCPHFEIEVEAAVTKEAAGEAIASFAIDFYKKYGERVKYPKSNVFAQRGGETYEAEPGALETYVLDCVGWVSYAVHHATGLTTPGIASGDNGFVVPENPDYGSNIGAWSNNLFEKVGTYGSVALMPGDVLANSHHVMIYVGDTEAYSAGGFSKASGPSIIDSRGHGPGNGLTYTTISEYGDIKNGDGVYRVSDAGAAAINESDLCKIALSTNKTTKKKKKDYGYYGLPERGEYSGSSSISFEWIINVLSQVADWLVGIITMGIKIELIGWATIVENIVTDAIQTITNEEIVGTNSEESGGAEDTIESDNTDTGDADDTDTGDTDDTADADSDNTGDTEEDDETGEPITESKRADEKDQYTPSAKETVVGFLTDRNDRITAEKIIYNQVPVFDVNVFNLETAAGQPLKEGGTLSIIKTNIAKWYSAFRNVAIVGLLLVLIYIGIRMAISAVATDKAKYKGMLLNWAVSFIIVLLIHYFMIFVINLNESLVEICKNMSPDQEVSLYETVRTKAYELKFSSGAVGTVLYLFLVYILFRYIFLYLKRYLVVNILVIIAPIIGISYSIDKIKDNKSQSLGAWMKDFSFMVLLQTIHALVYTAFVSTVLDMSSENIAGVVLGMIVLNFMLKADKIVIHIFGMDKSKTLSSALGAGIKESLAGLFVAQQWGSLFYKGAAGSAIKIGKKAGGFIGDVGALMIPDNIRYGFNGMYNRAMNGLFGEHAVNQRRTNNRTTVSGIEDKIRNEKLKNRRALYNEMMAPISSVKRRIGGFVKLGVGIPMAIANPEMLSSYGIFKMAQARKNGRIVYKPSAKRASGYKRNITRWVAKGVPITASIFEMNRERKDANKNRTLTFEKAQRKLEALEQMQKKEEDIVELAKDLRKNKIPAIGNGSNPLTTGLDEKFEKEFDKVVEEQLKEVDLSYVEKVVCEYSSEKGTESFKKNDIRKIVDRLQEELETDEQNREKYDSSKKKVTLSAKSENNIMEEMMKNSEVSLKQIEEIFEKQNDNGIIEFGKATEEQKKAVVEELKKTLEKTIEPEIILIELEKTLKNNKIEVNFGENAKERYKNKRRLARVLANESRVFTTKEVIDIVKNGVDVHSSIVREIVPKEYKEIVKQMKELQSLSKAYKKEFKEQVYSNSQLKSAMKKTKRAQGFDLYRHLVGDEYL